MTQNAATLTNTLNAENGQNSPPSRFTSPQARTFQKMEKKDRKSLQLNWSLKTDIIDRIKKSKGISVFIIDCTPDMAMDLLTLNDPGQNRYVDEGQIELYVEDMNRKQFMFNGDTIVVTETHKLMDGQHRLWSIVDSGITLKIIIVTGVDDKAFSRKDIGKKRSALDMMVIGGFRENAGALAFAVKNIIYSREKGRVSSSLDAKKVPNYKVAKFEENKKDVKLLHDFIEWGKNVNKKYHIKFFTPAQWGFLYYKLYKLPWSSDNQQKKVTTFLTQFASGEELSRNNPIKLLRDAFISDFHGITKTKKRNRISTDKLTLKIKFVLEAWNEWIDSPNAKVTELTPDLSDPRIQTAKHK